MGGHNCRWRVIGLFVSQLRAFLGFSKTFLPKFFSMRKLKIEINPYKSISNVMFSSNQPPEGWFRIVNTKSSDWLDENMIIDIDLYRLMSFFNFFILKNFGKKVSEKPKKALSCGTKSPITRKRHRWSPTFYTPSGSASRALFFPACPPVCNECGWRSKTRNTFFRPIMKFFDCLGLTFNNKIIV